MIRHSPPPRVLAQHRKAGWQVFSALLSHPSAEVVALAVLDPGEQTDRSVFESDPPQPGVSLWAAAPLESCPKVF